MVLFGSFLHFVYFSMLGVSSTAQHVYLMSSSVIWYQLHSAIQTLRWNLFISVGLGVVSTIFYLPSARCRRVMGLINFIFKRVPSQP